MKALSISQPWASLIVHGLKRYETRSWGTDFTGWVVIHASARFPVGDRLLCELEPFKAALASVGIVSWRDLPLGAGLGLVFMERCDDADWVAKRVTENELAFGNFSPGRYAYQMAAHGVFKRPLPAKGKLGFWEWEARDWIREQ